MLDSLRSHHDAIREEYRVQAPKWAVAAIGQHLEWVVNQIDLTPEQKALDVAAGTGLFSLAIAPRVANVVAVDITPEMIESGRKRAAENGATNITFQLGAAESLPFPSDSFDLVVTRFSVHHFKLPAVAIGEMARVCSHNGQVVIVDMVASDDPAVGARHNELERLADPTHTRALNVSELIDHMEDAGLTRCRCIPHEVEMTFDLWQSHLPADSKARLKIREALDAEIGGGQTTGMRPFRDGELLKFWHTWGVFLARKP